MLQRDIESKRERERERVQEREREREREFENFAKINYLKFIVFVQKL